MQYAKIAFALFAYTIISNGAEEIHTKVLILGSGPAGLTAGIYCARAQLQPIVLTGQHPGGHLTSTTYIDNWPGTQHIFGHTLMDMLHDHAVSAGARLLEETAISINLSEQPFSIITESGTTITCNTLILAMGSSPRRMQCTGENDYWGKGVYSCATCDGPLYKNKNVVVVGGGDSAMEYASFLSKYTKSITIVQMLDTLTASAPMQMRILQNDTFTIHYSSIVSKVIGDQEKITGIVITNIQTQEEIYIATDAVFVAIGHRPNTQLLKGQIELDATQHIVTHDHVKTSVPGVFAAGDIMEPLYKQAIVAAGLGCTAGLAAERYLLETRQHRCPCLRISSLYPANSIS